MMVATILLPKMKGGDVTKIILKSKMQKFLQDFEMINKAVKN